MDDGDSLMQAYGRAIIGDLEWVRKGLEMSKRESILCYVVSELMEAVRRDDRTKIFQIFRAISKDKVSSAVLTVFSSTRLTYWMGRKQGPPPLEWLNPYTRNQQTKGFLQTIDMPIEQWASM